MKLLSEFIDFGKLEIIKEGSGDKRTLKLKGPFLEAESLNKNGRRYSKEIIEREVGRFVENKIKKNRSCGELDHPECILSNDFDVLTLNGWKSFESLKVGEDIASLNDDGIIDYNPIDKIIDEYYEGTAYSIVGRGIDSAVTPGHRFLLKNRYGKLEYVTVEEIFNNRKKYNKHTIMRNGGWVGNDEDTMVIKGISEEEYFSKKYWQFKNDVRKDLEIDMLTFVRFLGIWLAEGHISLEKYQIFITQNLGEKCDKIENLLKSFPIEWNKTKKGENAVTFNVSDIRIWKYLHELGDCYNKYIPYEIKQISSIYLKELIDWFVLGDGRDQINASGNIRRNLFSCSKKLVEDLHECLIKSGGSGNWQIFEPDADYMFADHLILAKNKNTLYQLNLSTTSNGIYLDDRFIKIEKINHKGNVYCLNVKNSNFYMKQNNKAFWTGNSPSINLDRISHIIESLVMEGNVGVGVARLIDTPMGRIAKTLVDEGIILGMSTRGVGTLDGQNVKEDFQLLTVDLVADPSCEKAFVEGVLENKEYIVSGDQIVEVAVQNLKKKVDKKYESKSMSNLTLDYMMEFLNEIQRK